jgi:predicted Rossmann-fold nucleotide-binding protein
VLNTAGFYDRLSAFLDHAMHEGFLRPEHRSRLIVAPDTEALLAAWA